MSLAIESPCPSRLPSEAIMQTQRVLQVWLAFALMSLVAWQLAPPDIEIDGQIDPATALFASTVADVRAARPGSDREPPRTPPAEAKLLSEAAATAGGTSDGPVDRGGWESIDFNDAEHSVYRRRLVKSILSPAIPSALAQSQLDSISLGDDDVIRTYSRPLAEAIALDAANGSTATSPALQSQLESIGRDDMEVLLKYQR